MSASPPTTRALVALLASIVGWGLAPVATQFALRTTPATTVLALRFSIASILLLPVVRRPARPLQTEDWLRLSAAALLGVVGYNTAATFGLRETNASTAGFLIAIEPVLILVLVRLGGHEPVASGRWAGALLSVIGVVIIAASQGAGDAGGLTGMLLILVAAGCFAGFVVVIRPLSLRHGALGATAMTTLLGSLVIVAITAPQVDPATFGHIPPGTFSAVVGLSLGSTIVAMVLYNHAVSILGPGRAGSALNLVPVVTVAGGVAFLRQPIPSIILAGGTLVLIGVLVADRTPRRQIRR